jgi:hypothetical protein
MIAGRRTLNCSSLRSIAPAGMFFDGVMQPIVSQMGT